MIYDALNICLKNNKLWISLYYAPTKLWGIMENTHVSVGKNVHTCVQSPSKPQGFVKHPHICRGKTEMSVFVYVFTKPQGVHEAPPHLHAPQSKMRLGTITNTSQSKIWLGTFTETGDVCECPQSKIKYEAFKKTRGAFNISQSDLKQTVLYILINVRLRAIYKCPRVTHKTGEGRSWHS